MQSKEKPFDCVVCGSCVADILVKPFPLDTPIGSGTVSVVDPIEATTGGIVSNSAVAMARLGIKVAALGLVGDDHWGRMFRELLQAEQVDVTHLGTHGTAQTTTAAVLIDTDGQRSFAYCPGATDAVDRAIFLDRLALFQQTRIALVGYYSLLPNLQADLPEVLEAIQRAGCRTALDSAGDGGQLEPLTRALPYLDVYIPSRAEAMHQTGRSDPQEMLEVYRQHGAAGMIGVKLGDQGALLSPAPGQYLRIDPVRPPSPVVDTTGAGDAFYAGLLTGLLQGHGPADAGRLAAAAASFSITAKGATAGLRSYAETAQLAGLHGGF